MLWGYASFAALIGESCYKKGHSLIILNVILPTCGRLNIMSLSEIDFRKPKQPSDQPKKAIENPRLVRRNRRSVLVSMSQIHHKRNYWYVDRVRLSAIWNRRK